MHGALPWTGNHKPDESDPIAVGICYRPPDQEQVSKSFFRQLEEASCSQALFSWETLTTPKTAGRAAQQGTGNPRGLWSALLVTS